VFKNKHQIPSPKSQDCHPVALSKNAIKQKIIFKKIRRFSKTRPKRSPFGPTYRRHSFTMNQTQTEPGRPRPGKIFTSKLPNFRKTPSVYGNSTATGAIKNRGTVTTPLQTETI
jgi:hypothetical protein